MTPTAAAVGSNFTLAITGANLQTVKDLEFHNAGYGGGMGSGMMGGGPSQTMGTEDTNIKVSNVQSNASGTQVTASVQILSSAVAGARQIRLETAQGEVMGTMSGSLFTVTK